MSRVRKSKITGNYIYGKDTILEQEVGEYIDDLEFKVTYQSGILRCIPDEIVQQAVAKLYGELNEIQPDEG